MKHRNRTELVRTLAPEELDQLDMGQLSCLANRIGVGRDSYDSPEECRAAIWRLVQSERGGDDENDEPGVESLDPVQVLLAVEKELGFASASGGFPEWESYLVAISLVCTGYLSRINQLKTAEEFLRRAEGGR